MFEIQEEHGQFQDEPTGEIPNLIRGELYCPHCSDPNCEDASHQEIGTWVKLKKWWVDSGCLKFFEYYECPICLFKTIRRKITKEEYDLKKKNTFKIILEVFNDK